MLRKVLSLTALAVAMTSAACNSITGVEDTRLIQSGNDHGRNREPVIAPVSRGFCLDDLRAVQILSPAEGQMIYNGQLVTVQFDVQEFCAGWTASLRVSLDNGMNFAEVANAKNVESLDWKVPDQANLKPVIAVVISDDKGEVSADQALGFFYRRNDGPAHHDQEHD
jgi:hypothetical protein